VMEQVRACTVKVTLIDTEFDPRVKVTFPECVPTLRFPIVAIMSTVSEVPVEIVLLKGPVRSHETSSEIDKVPSPIQLPISAGCEGRSPVPSVPVKVTDPGVMEHVGDIGDCGGLVVSFIVIGSGVGVGVIVGVGVGVMFGVGVTCC